MLALSFPALEITLTVPLVTIIPDHVTALTFVDRLTRLPLASWNSQFDAVPLLRLHVAVAPRATKEGQLSTTTKTGTLTVLLAKLQAHGPGTGTRPWALPV